jgi:glycosyltransferase involved in cell wall biosynthesis
MATKVAFYLENRSIPDVDLSRPELGNPGCGGTEFLFAALPYYIQKYNGIGYDPLLLANHTDRLPDNLVHIRVEDVIDAARRAKEEGCSIFVYRPRRHTEAELLALIDTLQLPTIAWVHITPVAAHLRAIARSKYTKAVVCVEREQHDLAMDSAIWSKLTCIVNGFDVSGFKLSNPPTKELGLVVYLGALVPQKGFHILAKAWPRILSRYSQARLAVIGTGALYDTKAELGPLGVAERKYEQRFIMPYLTDKDGKLHPSVTFLGRLGSEKKEILYRATVGVPNPGGQTENCPGSALEFQACGTAVVSGAYYGLLDTVIHGKTGLLGRNEDDLVKNICRLLESREEAEGFGRNGVGFIEERYNFPKVVDLWCDLFSRIEQGRNPKYIPFKLNFHRHNKFLIVINRFLQITIGRAVRWPSILEIKGYLARKFLRVNGGM